MSSVGLYGPFASEESESVRSPSSPPPFPQPSTQNVPHRRDSEGAHHPPLLLHPEDHMSPVGKRTATARSPTYQCCIASQVYYNRSGIPIELGGEVRRRRASEMWIRKYIPLEMKVLYMDSTVLSIKGQPQFYTEHVDVILECFCRFSLKTWERSPNHRLQFACRV